MAIPTVDDVWADFNIDGSVHEPVKQDVRRLLRFIQAIGETNGMKVYPSKASMDADLTQPDGQAGLIYADATAANNYPTVWTWNDAGNVWVAGVDRISSLSTSVTLIQSIMRRAVVLSNEIIIDRLNMLGGGTGQIYIPQGILTDVPGAAAANLTILPVSAELAGYVKLAIPAGLRSFAYLDRWDNTYKIISATGGDFTLPGLNIDMIVPLIVFPSTGGRYASPFKVRELNPPEKGTAFLPTRPIVHSRADGKVLIPGGTFRSSLAGVVAHTVAAGAAYEEFDLSASGTNAITYWFNTKTNAYVATTAGAEPFNIDPTLGILLGYSFGNEFWSPWPHVGIGGLGRGENTFDKGKLPSQAPKAQVPSNAHIVAITETNLVALGFTEGMANNHATTGSLPAYGDFLPDTRFPARVFARVFIQTTVDNDFGLPRAWFVKDPAFSSASNSFVLSLEKQLSSKAAIYSASFALPDPAAATNPAGPWSFYYVGTGTASAPDRYAVTGVQFDIGRNVRWIERNDFPTVANNAKRIAALESSQSVFDPAIALLYGPDMWLVDGREQKLYPDNLNETRSDAKLFETMLVSLTHTAVDTEGDSIADMTAVDAYSPESTGAAIPITPSRMGDETYIIVRRYSDTGANPDRRYSRRGVTVHKAPATVTATKTLHMTGDSLTSPATIKQQLKAKLKQIGITANFVGTLQYGSSKVGNEGRGGWSFASVINGVTLSPPSIPAGLTQPLAVGQEANYLLLDDDTTKIPYNPYIRISAGGDPAGNIFNDYIFDFSFYLNRWSGTSLGALPVPDLVILNFGTGDINLFAEPITSQWITKGLDIVTASMLAAGVGHIGIVFPTIPHSGRNAVWPEQAAAIRTLINWHATKANPLIDLLPAWAHMSQNAGWPTTAVVDAATGAAVETITASGETHYYDDLNRTTINEVHAAWIACKVAGI